MYFICSGSFASKSLCSNIWGEAWCFLGARGAVHPSQHRAPQAGPLGPRDVPVFGDGAAGHTGRGAWAPSRRDACPSERSRRRTPANPGEASLGGPWTWEKSRPVVYAPESRARWGAAPADARGVRAPRGGGAVAALRELNAARNAEPPCGSLSPGGPARGPPRAGQNRRRSGRTPPAPATSLLLAESPDQTSVANVPGASACPCPAALGYGYCGRLHEKSPRPLANHARSTARSQVPPAPRGPATPARTGAALGTTAGRAPASRRHAARWPVTP